MPAAAVVKVDDLCADNYVVSDPVNMGEHRICSVTGPMLQARDLVIAFDADRAVVSCSEEYADAIAAIDDTICAAITERSARWFGKAITHDHVEQMMRPSLHGHRNPKHVVDAFSCKCFDEDLEPCDRPDGCTAMIIVRCDGVRFDAKSCEVMWTLVQMKKLADAPEEDEAEDESNNDDEPSPLFLS